MTKDLLLAPRAADHLIGVASAARLLLLLSPRGAGARASRARLHIGLAASKASSLRFAQDDNGAAPALSSAVPFSRPDFKSPELASAPDARFVAAPADGVLPDGFFSTTNLPTYVRIKGEWRLPREPRMDSALVLDRDGSLWVKEGRRLRKGDLVAVGAAEDGTEGIFVQTDLIGADTGDEFKFMTSEVSREKPIDYAVMAQLLVDERERGGYPIWVTGPALVHSRARNDMSWFIANGFVGALLAGNAVAVHDIEASIFGTTLGMTRTGEATSGGHGLHMRAINQVRAAGSIANAVRQGIIKDGIMFSCVTHNVPFVLTGSMTVLCLTSSPIRSPDRTP